MARETTEFEDAVKHVKNGRDLSATTSELFSKLSEDEKLALLQGDMPFWQGLLNLYTGVYATTPYVHGEIKRLGILGVRYCDGPRGVNIHRATAFPCSMARGATWDLELEMAVGRAIGLEARACDANMVGSACINLPRHPAWGRAQETYGEDPLLLGEFGAAHVRGLQENVMGCVKHFALNSMETSRFRVDVEVDDAALHEAFLPHFRKCVDAGALAIMTAYNSVNGEWAGESRQLIRDILRDRWGFGGITISDWLFGLRDGVKSVAAGLDIEAPFRNRRHATLQPALSSGRLRIGDVDRIAARILRTQLAHYAARDEAQPSRDVLFSEEHRSLARRVAERSIILLKNDNVDGRPVLPLPTDLSSIAVVGRLADTPLTGDRASSWVDCPEITTPLAGIRAEFPSAEVHVSASDSEEEAVRAASGAQFAVVIVGYDGFDEGEFLRPSREKDFEALSLFPPPDGTPASDMVQAARSQASGGEGEGEGERGLASRPTGGDRASVRLRPRDVRLIRAVSAANPRTVVSIITAGAVITEEWRHLVPGLLVSWYNGWANGPALAAVLSGASNPSGRLPWSMPRSEAHLPPFEADTGRIVYDKWFGQRLLDRMGVRAAYPLGYGLSYTQFELDDARVFVHSTAASGDVSGGRVEIDVLVRNTGLKEGWAVVQVYGRPDFGPIPQDFPNHVLVGFKAEHFRAQSSRRVVVSIDLQPLMRWRDGGFVLDAKRVVYGVGQHAGDPKTLTVSTDKPTAKI
ncbi:related to beta-glucosidase [Cephalotrichum gorgonifer]|uniref:beta-glucosidase n=1 Tax=Cephalotrichum gorgonifer TaxID=2041049 RepID=A0AAE8SZM5_9PEZI|nr:related to beta-glucosidase [Cephalotrichum gorgonifer]